MSDDAFVRNPSKFVIIRDGVVVAEIKALPPPKSTERKR